MALPPKFAGHKLPLTNAPSTQHTLELFLDYNCPFCAKLFSTFYNSVYQLLEREYAGKLCVIFRQHVQPWQPSSVLVHEAGLAVQRLAPEKFWPFSAKLFNMQTDFFDVNVVHETRNETYQRLAKVAASVGVDEGKVLELLTVSDTPASDGTMDVGNSVTNDLVRIIKANRTVGVHVSPTIFFDGIEEKGVGSSSTASQWEEWLRENIV